MTNDEWSAWKAERGMLPPAPTPHLAAIVRGILSWQDTHGGESPEVFRVSPEVHANAYLEMVAARRRAKLPVLAANIPQTNFLVCGVPVVCDEH